MRELPGRRRFHRLDGGPDGGSDLRGPGHRPPPHRQPPALGSERAGCAQSRAAFRRRGHRVRLNGWWIAVPSARLRLFYGCFSAIGAHGGTRFRTLGHRRSPRCQRQRPVPGCPKNNKLAPVLQVWPNSSSIGDYRTAHDALGRAHQGTLRPVLARPLSMAWAGGSWTSLNTRNYQSGQVDTSRLPKKREGGVEGGTRPVAFVASP